MSCYWFSSHDILIFNISALYRSEIPYHILACLSVMDHWLYVFSHIALVNLGLAGLLLVVRRVDVCSFVCHWELGFKVWGLRFGVCICICEYVIFVEDVRYCLVVSLCCVI